MVLSHPFLRTTRKRKSAAVEPWNAPPKNNVTRCRVFCVNDRPSIEQQKKMSHVLSDFVSAGASEASPCTGISAAEKENECRGQQERQPQSEGTVSVQNQFVNTEVWQSERRSFPQVFFNCIVQVHNYYGGRELEKSS